MLVCQVALVVSLCIMAHMDPTASTSGMATIALCVAFFSASQDIVIDAYRTEILVPLEFGAGAAVANLGYRLAMLFSGAAALILADHLSWKSVYLTMAATLSIGILTSFLAPDPKTKIKPPHNLREAVIEPLLEFLKRRGSLEVIGFIIIYKLDVVVTLALMTPFLLSLGFTKTDIGTVTKGFGLFATLLGSFVGGAWMTRLGIHKSLWIFGILQGISGLCFYVLARLGHHYPMMVTTIAAESFFSGMGNAAYSAFLMSLCHPRFTAFQFALLTSLMALTRTLAGAPTGWLAKTVGWETYFLVAMLLAIPSFILLVRFRSWVKPLSN